MGELARPVSVGLVLALAGAGPAAGQSAVRSQLCFQAAPSPECSASVVTEFGGGLHLASNGVDPRVTLFQWNLGAMKHLGTRAGLGGAVFATWAEGAVTAGFAPRFRYWATPGVSLDLAPGLILLQGGARNVGFNGVVAANLGSHASLTSTIQVTRSGESLDNRPLQRVEWFAGMRFTGKAGAVNGIAAPILAFLAYLALSSRSS